MLSYMLPMDEDPTKPHLQLAGTTEINERITPISKDTSISSFVSDATTATASSASGKTKFIINGGRHQTLKRVSFGSSKGSMVETLIFESPVQEEPEPDQVESSYPFPEDEDQTESEREKVRVTFFQQSKPQEVDLPIEPVIFSDEELMMATTLSMNETNHVVYDRTESVESGWDNPFRPDGELSKEADEIVELIKGGKPITPTPGSTAPTVFDEGDNHTSNNHHRQEEPKLGTPKKVDGLNTSIKSANGNVNSDKPSSPEAVDIQRGTVKPDGDASQIEHITIKKKPKCKCCVIQ